MDAMPSLMDNVLAVGYMLIWVLTFIWYQRRCKNVDAGSMVIGSYVAYAAFSIVTLNDEVFNYEYEHLAFFPFLYLFVMLMIALSPAIYHHFSQPEKIENPHSKALYIPCLILIVSVLFQLPDAFFGSGGGITQIVTDIDAGKEAYLEQLSEKEDSGTAIRNLASVLFNLFFDISTFLFFYFCTRKGDNRIFLLVLFFALFVGMIIPVVNGQRGSVIKAGLTIIVAYSLFRRYLSEQFNRIAKTVGITMAVIVAIPITAITVSRFDDRKVTETISGFVYWYIGQANIYFNNSAMDPGGIRNGDRTINMVKRAIWSDTPKNYVERRDKYSYLKIDDYYFVTFVGDFVIDFGPVIAFFIFVIFNLWVLSEIRPRDGTIKLHQLLLIYFTLCICMQGGMVLFSYSDTGNLIVLVFFFLYSWLRYHDALLRRFPLQVKESPAIPIAEQ
jgi:oligosaccharide repeat unit polymerase